MRSGNEVKDPEVEHDHERRERYDGNGGCQEREGWLLCAEKELLD